MEQNFEKKSPLGPNVPNATGQERTSENLPENSQDFRSEHRPQDDGTMRLDDSQRVKVLSPGAMVFKRFMRNKLAIVGVCILVLMFLFSFLAPVFYPYAQTQVFYKYDTINSHYAGVNVRSDFVNYVVDPNVEISENAKLMINSDINALNAAGTDKLNIDRDGTFVLEKLGDQVYTTSAVSYETVASFNAGYTVGSFDNIKKTISSYADGVSPLGADFEALVADAITSNALTFEYEGLEYTVVKESKMSSRVDCSSESITYTGENLGADFEAALADAISAEASTVSFGGVDYELTSNVNGGYDVRLVSGTALGTVSTTLVFDTTADVTISDELRVQALLNAYNGKSFTVEGVSYSVEHDEDGKMTLFSDGTVIANMTNLAVRDTLGGDTLSLEFKAAAEEVVTEMTEKGLDTTTFVFSMEKLEITTNEAGQDVTSVVLDESGNPIMEDTTLTISRKTGQYEIHCPQIRYLIDINSAPSSDHWLGTDANGMDTLARLMYGGRISLMVGFIVVFLELIIGVIMGGIAGYFGGWVDTLIMRLVDIFRCIPSMPILIILASFMDAEQVDSYVRLMYMMAVLGFLGWAGIARLVRGQILSLREQEFMTAAEATGIRVRRRIFQHLVPNVMPQLIVTATSSLGGVILTESTLSFLGLGVKFPLATWGNIINTVTKTNENLLRYTYIWIPVGLLICLTVIAFNFVGDGLRDAFDPKMKR